MTHKQALRARQKLLERLPVTGEILRGSLLNRIIRPHGRKCAKCASGEGHPLNVLTVTYPGGRTRQFSLRPELVPQVRHWLENYKNLKERSRRSVVRVLTRVMKKVTKIAGDVGCKLRDRSRSVKHRVMEIGRAARAKGAQGKEKLRKAYANLLNSTSRVVGQAKRF